MNPESSNGSDMATQTPNDSRTELTEVVLTSQVDQRGLAYAGEIVSWIDICSGICAFRHAKNVAVTASVDAVHFVGSARASDILSLSAQVTRSWNSSMEVKVKVTAESALSGERHHVCVAFLTFVALDSVMRKPTQVPILIPETEEEKLFFEGAQIRKDRRISIKDEFVAHEKEVNSEGTWSHAQLEALFLQHLQEDAISETAALMPATSSTCSQHHDDIHLLMEKGYCLHGSPFVPITQNLPAVKNSSNNSSETQGSVKTANESYAEMFKVVMPQHANTLNITFGGQIVKWIEQCAMVSAARHAHAYLVTASIDSLHFLQPTRVGDCVHLKSYVSRVFHSSMEIYVSATALNASTGEKRFANDAYVTILALNEQGHPIHVPKVKPTNKEEMLRFKTAPSRRKHRLELRSEHRHSFMSQKSL